MTLAQQIQKDLDNRFRKSIWRPMMAAIKQHKLIEAGDRIAVCMSGGKDSLLLAKCMQNLQRHFHLSFELCFICMDPGFEPETRAQIEALAAELKIPLEFFETDVFAALEATDCSPCQLCAKMRRGYLYRRAKALGCNKIALGHHFDDVIETLLMSMLCSGQVRGMRPILVSDNVEGMQLIRPLYNVREQVILEWVQAYELNLPSCACKKSRSPARQVGRKAIGDALSELEARIPGAQKNLFRSAYNVQLDSLNGWKLDDDWVYPC